MDMFWAFLLWSAAMIGLGYGAHSLIEEQQQANQIAKTGQLELRSTLYSCKPISSMVGGKRILLEESK